MVSIKPRDIEERDNYKLLIGSIIPRPIAVVSSLSKEGVVNLAPFSYFNVVTSNPPIVSLAIQRKSGVMKDTARNITEQKEAVIHIADKEHLEDINQTAANCLANESELTRTHFTLGESELVRVPLVNELKIKMEVELYQHIPIEDDTGVTADLLLLKVINYHIDDDIYEEGKINADKLQPMSRLAGPNYAELGEVTSLVRPD